MFWMYTVWEESYDIILLKQLCVLLLSWWSSTASKLSGGAKSRVFCRSLEWLKPNGLSGSEDQMKVWDGFELKPCPTK